MSWHQTDLYDDKYACFKFKPSLDSQLCSGSVFSLSWLKLKISYFLTTLGHTPFSVDLNITLFLLVFIFLFVFLYQILLKWGSMPNHGINMVGRAQGQAEPSCFQLLKKFCPMCVVFLYLFSGNLSITWCCMSKLYLTEETHLYWVRSWHSSCRGA